MTYRSQTEDSKSLREVGRIEVGQAIRHFALSFGIHQSIISRLSIQPNNCPKVSYRSFNDYDPPG